MSSQIGFLFATFVVQSFDCYTLFTKKPSLLKKIFLFLSCARFASDFLFSFQRPLSASFDADQHTGSLSRTFIVTETIPGIWWAQVDSNHRPCAYQAHALTT